MRGLEEYFRVAKIYGILMSGIADSDYILIITLWSLLARPFAFDLSSRYLFRPVLGGKTVLNDSLSYSEIYEILKTYLSLSGIDEVEMLHSMRAGCAVTLALSGSVDQKM